MNLLKDQSIYTLGDHFTEKLVLDGHPRDLFADVCLLEVST